MSCPSIDRAAAGPPLRALAQCSTRTYRPKSGWKDDATSPASNTSAAEVRSAWSVTTPLSTSSPAAAASSMLGVAPTPTTTRSAGSPAGPSVTTDVTRPPVPGNSRPVEGGGLWFHDRHVVAVVAGRRGHLEADPARPHDQYPLPAAGEVGQQP